MNAADTRELLARIVKAYDIRAEVQEVPLDLVRAIGAAAAEELAGGRDRLLVGRDMRRSSPMWSDAFAEGVCSTGRDVIDLGEVSTDLVSFASGRLDAAGAMITASHNPASYNGIKLCRPGAAPVSLDTGLGAIRERVLLGSTMSPDAHPSEASPRGRRRDRDLLPDFAAHVRSFVSEERLREVRVVVDAGNGMAGRIWPAVVEGLPILTTPLYFELDGTFPHHPANPLDTANLEDLRREVRAGSQALGLAFDGDADRVFAVDEHGRPVASSLVGAAVAERLLERHPGATILYNLICSRVVPETVRAAGGTAIRTRVGHSLIKQRMAETDAVFAVEHSGHYYFRDNFRADSGVIAALVLLETVAEAGCPLGEVLAPYDRYPGSGERNLAVADPAVTLAQVRAHFDAEARDLDEEDGLTISLDDAWFNLRPSNTEPVLRLNVEGDDVAALDRTLDRVLKVVEQAEAGG